MALLNSIVKINQVFQIFLSIYSGLTDEPIKDIEVRYEGEGYGKFKGDLAEIVKDFLINFQEKYENFYNSDDLDDILDKGRDKAHKASFKTLKKWKKLWD